MVGSQAAEPYRVFDGNRPSAFLSMEQLDAHSLGALIARMDAQPVRFVKGGFVH